MDGDLSGSPIVETNLSALMKGGAPAFARAYDWAGRHRRCLICWSGWIGEQKEPLVRCLGNGRCPGFLEEREESGQFQPPWRTTPEAGNQDYAAETTDFVERLRRYRYHAIRVLAASSLLRTDLRFLRCLKKQHLSCGHERQRVDSTSAAPLAAALGPVFHCRRQNRVLRVGLL